VWHFGVQALKPLPVGTSLGCIYSHMVLLTFQRGWVFTKQKKEKVKVLTGVQRKGLSDPGQFTGIREAGIRKMFVDCYENSCRDIRNPGIGRNNRVKLYEKD